MTEQKKIDLPEKLQKYISEQIELGISKALEGMVPNIPNAEGTVESEEVIEQKNLLRAMGYAEGEELDKAYKDYFDKDSGEE